MRRLTSVYVQDPARDSGGKQGVLLAGHGKLELPNDTYGTNETNTAAVNKSSALFVSFVTFVSFGSSIISWPSRLTATEVG